MRKHEREQSAAVARRRLERVRADLADLADLQTHDPRDREAPAGPTDTGGPASFEQPEPIAAGPPAGLDAPVLYAARGRALPPEPAVVAAPGRHAVSRRGRGETPPEISSGRNRVPDWVDERLPAALRGRVPFTGQHLTLLAGALAVVLLVTGWMTMRGSHQDAVPAARFTTPRASGAAAVTPSASASPVGAAGSPVPAPSGDSGGAVGASGSVVVDVAGKVRRPGVVTLAAGSRIQDAIARAGGVQPGARTDSLNLARVLVDGEQIRVGLPAVAGSAPAAASTGGSGSAASQDPASGASGTVSLNSADQTQLEELPGVGPVTAQKIIEWRTAHGAFSSVNELLEVDGIGEKTLADIAPHATL